MSEAPEAIRADPRFARVVEVREDDASIARSARDDFRRLTSLLIIATALASVAGGLVLYGTEAQPVDSRWLVGKLADGPLRSLLIVLQAVSLAAAGYAGYILGQSRPGEVWVAHRLRAEDGRLTLARRALEIGHDLGPKRFQEAGQWYLGFLTEQREHLRKSAAERERSASGLIALGAMLAALTALAGALAGLSQKLVIVLVAILGVCSPALVAAISSWSRATQNQKRAALHRDTWQKLNLVGEKEAEFHTALDANDLTAALQYVEEVSAILREDHAGFAAALEPGEQPGAKSPAQ